MDDYLGEKIPPKVDVKLCVMAGANASTLIAILIYTVSFPNARIPYSRHLEKVAAIQRF